MKIEQQVLVSALMILALACLEIQACLPVIVPAVAAIGGAFAGGRAIGAKRAKKHPENPMKGCFADSVNARAMGKAVLHDEKLTKMLCTDKCREAKTQYLGMQNGTECYCANSYDRFGPISNLKCNTPCGGDSKEMCGGYMANSVYTV